ncbi:MAG: DUF547 domain-containing protein [Saprospiraceae bacterium]|nr:DUF547 domain-containing protein [Saprospiraceae bacterium]MDW8484468.1 DUF547 domain-containing protein [Saprospiraceae bacterium]
MKKILLVFFALMTFFVLWFMCANCRPIRRKTTSLPVSHERWDALLKKHVDSNGLVRYQELLRDSAELNAYLRLLEGAHPNDKTWTRAEQMAYWINAYNAFTIQLILRHYPVKSIKDIKQGIAFVNSVWDIKFIRIQGYTYDLNNIEHNILRPIFKDARIHAAINCASFSCPRLRNEAYVADRLDAQLDDAMRRFINDPLRNRISAEKAELSKIFSWFSRDFERDAGSIRAYLNRYAQTPIGPQTPISYLEYDWSLNEAK